MNTFVVSPQTENLPITELLMRAREGSLTVLDVDGNVVAYLLSPASREELIYAEARLDLEQHREDVNEALNRRGGITTKELLEKAKAASALQNPEP